MATIILDAGHGGNDLGDAYGFRYEKDDNLKLTLELGDELERLGYKVVYTRISDVYLSQNERVNIANNAEGDLLLTIHRLVGEIINANRGLGFYINERGQVAELAAENIAKELLPLGFCNYGIEVRSELPILRDTDMPALMMGIGYLNSPSDNILFDTRLHEIATAIALGIYNTIPVNNIENAHSSTNEASNVSNGSSVLYGVQVGLFSNYNNAVNLYEELISKGYNAQIIFREPYYAVIVGYYDNLDTVAEVEFRLSLEGYDTLLVSF